MKTSSTWWSGWLQPFDCVLALCRQQHGHCYGSIFQGSTTLYGVPSHVRADRGGENIRVAEYMISQRGDGRGSFIFGKGVHNQRIERMWRDVFSGCLVQYYGLFYHMEDIGILNVENQVHIFCLHYIFLPRINSSLQQFLSAWNNHPMSSMSQMSPSQLWMDDWHTTQSCY